MKRSGQVALVLMGLTGTTAAGRVRGRAPATKGLTDPSEWSLRESQPARLGR